MLLVRINSDDAVSMQADVLSDGSGADCFAFLEFFILSAVTKIGRTIVIVFAPASCTASCISKSSTIFGSG